MSEKTYLWLMGGALAVLGVWVWKTRAPVVAPATIAVLAPPSALAKWPLIGAKTQNGPRGVTHFIARDADGTDVDLIEFDFKTNPRLRLELFDQNSDSPHPFDDRARYWGRNAAYILTHEAKGGRIIAACNGGPFGFNRIVLKDRAHHVAPLIYNGAVYFNAAAIDWDQAWVVGVRDGKAPRFEAVLRPSPTQLRTYTWGTGEVQCLVKDGAPLTLGGAPTGGKWPVYLAPGPMEAGTFGKTDWTKTSRVSLGWSRDGAKLWMLSVHDPEAEAASRVALSLRVRGSTNAQTPPITGGWSAFDVQNFWKSKGAWGAVLVTTGDFAQLAARRSDGQIEFVPSHVADIFWKTAHGRTRLTCPPDLKGAPSGGSALFYWVVREGDAR